MPMSRASLFSQLLLLSLSPDENIWENCELIAFLSVEKQFKSPCYHQDNILVNMLIICKRRLTFPLKHVQRIYTIQNPTMRCLQFQEQRFQKYLEISAKGWGSCSVTRSLKESKFCYQLIYIICYYVLTCHQSTIPL